MCEKCVYKEVCKYVAFMLGADSDIHTIIAEKIPEDVPVIIELKCKQFRKKRKGSEKI